MSDADDFDAYARNCLGPDGAEQMLRETAAAARQRSDDTVTVITKSGAYFEERGEAGAYVRVEDVAELVKAARAACNAYFCTPQPRNTRDLIGLLDEALGPFEGP